MLALGLGKIKKKPPKPPPKQTLEEAIAALAGDKTEEEGSETNSVPDKQKVKAAKPMAEVTTPSTAAINALKKLNITKCLLNQEWSNYLSPIFITMRRKVCSRVYI